MRRLFVKALRGGCLASSLQRILISLLHTSHERFRAQLVTLGAKGVPIHLQSSTYQPCWEVRHDAARVANIKRLHVTSILSDVDWRSSTSDKLTVSTFRTALHVNTSAVLPFGCPSFWQYSIGKLSSRVAPIPTVSCGSIGG